MDSDIAEGWVNAWEANTVVIRDSSIDGLNPVECLLHSIAGRANFFSENADVPGTLTKKLMYHWGDTSEDGLLGVLMGNK